MVGKIFIDYDEMEMKYDELRRYGEIVDDETPHFDGTFWHRKTMYLYDDKVWLVNMVGGGIEYLLDVTTLTRIEAKDNRKNDIVTFDNISVGECFEYDDHTYLRMEDVAYSDEMAYNAVDLEYGIVEDFDCDATVTRLKNAKITLL